MKRAWLFMLVVAALTLAACGGNGEAPAADGGDAVDVAAIGDPQAGEQIYRTGGASQVGCVTCHTLDGTDLVGPSLDGISEVAAERVPGMSAEDYLHESIVQPDAYLVEGYDDLMPKNYGETLSEEDIDNVIAFLLTQ